LATVPDILAVNDVRAVAQLLTAVLDRPVDPDKLRLHRPGGGGWSNDTVVVHLGADRVVVRRAPERAAMFPTYNLAREHDCLRALASTVPVPAILGADLTGDILGRPAFVMSFVDGRVPSDDRPTFVEAGWLHDADPAQQRQFHTSLLASMAAVNATSPPDTVVAALRRPGRSGCAGLVDDLEAIWRFDPGAHWSAIVEDTFAAVRADVPYDDSPGRLRDCGLGPSGA
jgi:aminoglycoside phosphotransferase (APT) family kinase protein